MKKDWAIFVFILACSGCAVLDTTEQERIAKAWCLNIRASQVIPVYPLTADLKPGDLFVVPFTVEREARMYQGRGFMPLTGLVGRVSPVEYRTFYPRYSPDGNGWPFTTMKNGNGPSCPQVAFPTYTVRTSRQNGIDMAVPVNGVAVGLDLLEAKEATATVSIDGAYTYGLDETTLRYAVERWLDDQKRQEAEVKQPLQPVLAATHGSPSGKGTVDEIPLSPPPVLGRFTPRNAERIHNDYVWDHLVDSLLGRNPYEKTFHLRVVTRVFLASSVTVSITATGNGSAHLDASSRLTQLAQRVEEANKSGSGLKLSFVSSSSNSVTLRTTFPEPLVFGYHAFDVPINEKGNPDWTRAMETGSKLSVRTPDPLTATANQLTGQSK
jgi:hypothetical protein